MSNSLGTVELSTIYKSTTYTVKIPIITVSAITQD